MKSSVSTNSCIHDRARPLIWLMRQASLCAGIGCWMVLGNLMQAVDVPVAANKSQERPAQKRTTLLVPLPAEPAWQDMAFLAAVPAATVVNNGAPSLISLEISGTLSPEVQDYLRRYRPDNVMLVGSAADGQVIAGRACGVLRAVSASEAACQLSAQFWRTCASAVMCAEDDYEAGLVAAPLAARLRAPLLFAGAQGLSAAGIQELSRLQAKELIVVGKISGKLPNQIKVTELANAQAVMGWTRKSGLKVTYLAALNPLDRRRTVIKKLSLAGALLAAGRGGLVAPLTYAVRWKKPFNGVEIKGELPARLPASEIKPKEGRIILGENEYAFVFTSKRDENERKVSIDLDGDDICTGPGDGIFVSGDTVELAGKRYAITLGGGKNDVFKAGDVNLTWPTAEHLAADLRQFYAALGAPPEHVCLVGFPDAIPHAIIGKGGIIEEQTSDTLYANADEDEFFEIGVARVIGESASFATLFASRTLTYSSLWDAEWQDKACQARWENTCKNQFENVGFDASFLHAAEDMKWLEPPTSGNPGKRKTTFEQESPLARCAILAHMDHSWWREMGKTFDWDAEVLMAPVVIESGGCLTAALDREPDYRSVIARLFRKGAVAFSGNTREGCATEELQRMEFWNGVLSGQTLGQAHRRSQNSALVTILDRKEKENGSYRYQLNIRIQFGDPAFIVRVPHPPRLAPAHVSVVGDIVTVHAPAQWWPIKIFVPEDWKQWTEKGLFVLRGAGTYARQEWCAEQYNRDETFLTAELTTRRRVSSISQVQTLAAPLGWKNDFYVDEHLDGSRTYRWAVRLADFDQIKGVTISAVERLDYLVVYK